MPDIGAMKDLLWGVERAAGPELELDAAIDVALFGGETIWKTANYTMEQYPVSHRPSGNHIGGFANEYVPRVTSSIDACVALIEKALPGWEVVLEIHAAASDAGVYSPAWPNGPNASGEGATPPLALLAATLRALILIEERKALAEGETP